MNYFKIIIIIKIVKANIETFKGLNIFSLLELLLISKKLSLSIIPGNFFPAIFMSMYISSAYFIFKSFEESQSLTSVIVEIVVVYLASIY